MAWDYNNNKKRWTLPFVSRNGVSCRVDIYKYGYTGSTVDTLTGATTPFSYEEDDSSDILNNTIRYKTGYLRVIETETGELNELRPTSDSVHYIEFYYGNRLDFIGFMQSQDFQQEYLPAPCEVDLPIASPLWLAFNRRFTGRVPQHVTLGALMDEICASLGVYSHVMFPYTFSSYDIKLDEVIFSSVISPWNQEFIHADTSPARNPLYEPVTFDYLLDAICKAFGWVLHDDVTRLTFSMFDYKAKYAIYPVGHIGNTSYLNTTDGENGGTAVNVEDSFTYEDNSASSSQIMPYGNIKIDYEGDTETDESLSYKRTYTYGTAQWENAIFACFLQGPLETKELPYGLNDSFDPTGRLNGVGAHVLAFYTLDDTNVREGIAYALKSNQQVNDEMFRVRLYTKFTNLIWNIDYKLESGVNLRTMTEDDTDHRYGAISVTKDVQDGYIDFIFKVTRLGNTEVMGSWVVTWNSRDTMFFSDISFYAVSDDRFINYTSKTRGYDTINGWNGSLEDGDVTMPISLYRRNNRMIGTTLRNTKITEYGYLLNRRNELQAKFKVVNAQSGIWCKLWKYATASWRWRIIATSFDPWNDEITLTMQRSTTLE